MIKDAVLFISIIASTVLNALPIQGYSQLDVFTKDVASLKLNYYHSWMMSFFILFSLMLFFEPRTSKRLAKGLMVRLQFFSYFFHFLF
jgi:hypothetical protein